MLSAAFPEPQFLDPYTHITKREIGYVHTSLERQELIARTAYYRAQSRGFALGYELEDWLAAEAEVNAACGLIEPGPRWYMDTNAAN